jgi:hypothetical protein
MSIKTADRIVELPEKVIADLNVLRQYYATEVSMCDDLEISQQNFGRLKKTGMLRTSSLHNLELNLKSALLKKQKK